MSLASEMLLLLIKCLEEVSYIFCLPFFFFLTCTGMYHNSGNLLCLPKMCIIHCISRSFHNWIGHMLMWYPDKQEVSKQAHYVKFGVNKTYQHLI